MTTKFSIQPTKHAGFRFIAAAVMPAGLALLCSCTETKQYSNVEENGNSYTIVTTTTQLFDNVIDRTTDKYLTQSAEAKQIAANQLNAILLKINKDHSDFTGNQNSQSNSFTPSK